MPDSNILVVLFSTIASIVAALTGLIGAFATFKLQKLETKLDFLKDYTLHKDLKEKQTLNHKIREHSYISIREIYVHNLEAIDVLRKCIKEFDYHNHSKEYTYDLENITNFQHQYDKIKNITRVEFLKSLLFVVLNIIALLFANAILNTSWLWVFICIDLIVLIYTFSLFFKQLKLLMS